MYLGNHWSYNLRNDPKRFAFVLARYAFAADMTSKTRSILELGCSEGIGTSMLAGKEKAYFGVDLDESAIQSARENYQGYSNSTFLFDDFMGKKYGDFGALVSLDVIEHILPEYENLYFETARNNLEEGGICVVGTPNITAAQYASEASNLGHVNLYSLERLTEAMGNYFNSVLPFGMNDEVVHTGFPAMSHYIFCIGRK